MVREQQLMNKSLLMSKSKTWVDQGKKWILPDNNEGYILVNDGQHALEVLSDDSNSFTIVQLRPRVSPRTNSQTWKVIPCKDGWRLIRHPSSGLYLSLTSSRNLTLSHSKIQNPTPETNEDLSNKGCKDQVSQSKSKIFFIYFF